MILSRSALFSGIVPTPKESQLPALLAGGVERGFLMSMPGTVLMGRKKEAIQRVRVDVLERDKQTLPRRRDAAWDRYFATVLGSRQAVHALNAVKRLF